MKNKYSKGDVKRAVTVVTDRKISSKEAEILLSALQHFVIMLMNWFVDMDCQRPGSKLALDIEL
jgi:hypothetical protein